MLFRSWSPGGDLCRPLPCFLYSFFYIEVWLIYIVVLISAVQQSDCYTNIYILFFHILFHSGLSWDTEYSYLCYTVGPCCLSILYIIAYLSTPDLPQGIAGLSLHSGLSFSQFMSPAHEFSNPIEAFFLGWC